MWRYISLRNVHICFKPKVDLKAARTDSQTTPEAAALAWLVWFWSCRNDCAPPTEYLAFQCMIPNEGTKSKSKKIRNPNRGWFRYLRSSPYKHVKWNLRANWILASALTQNVEIQNGQGYRDTSALIALRNAQRGPAMTTAGFFCHQTK